MVVAGPNARKDYHYNETEELFYQLEGSIKLSFKKMESKEMECRRYVPSRKTPHSPVRSEGSIGLVIERKRAGQGCRWTTGFVIIVIICTKCILN
jgi:3-hydroxyanthranilate 3,4-dioxygenase